MSDSNEGGSCGCGCIPIIIGILLLTALWFGLPFPGGHVYNIDLFPPRIWDMNEVPGD